MSNQAHDREEEMEKAEQTEIARELNALRIGLDKNNQSLERIKEVLREIPEISHRQELAPDPDVKMPPKPLSHA